jgi:hypothetical protein
MKTIIYQPKEVEFNERYNIAIRMANLTYKKEYVLIIGELSKTKIKVCCILDDNDKQHYFLSNNEDFKTVKND